MIEKTIRDALFKELHKAIDESAEYVCRLDASGLAYPPGVELSSEESEAITSLQLSDAAKAALRKLVTDACSAPLFHFFSLLDAVADPEAELDEMWMGATIEAKNDEEDEPMLHDELFGSYWLYKDM